MKFTIPILNRAVYLLMALLIVGASILILTLRQPYGWISLPGLLLAFISFRYIKSGILKWVLTSIGISAGLFCIGSGLVFMKYNADNRKKFDIETAVKFEKDTFQNSLNKAKQEKKVVFLDLYTAWCGPCLQFSQTVLMDEEVGELMNQAFVNVKFDAEVGEGIAVARRYAATGYPTLLIVDSDGNIIEEVNKDFLPDNDQMKTFAQKYLSNTNLTKK